MEIRKVIVERWIIVDDNGIRRSTWFQTQEEAEDNLVKLESKDDPAVTDERI